MCQFPNQLGNYELKVDAVWQFRPNTRPTNPEVWGMPPDEKEADGMTRVPIPEDIQFRMELQWALLRSTGFWDVFVRSPDEVDQLAEALAMARLNADTNIDIADQAKKLLPDRLSVSELIVLMEEVLPADRKRFVKYMSERPLGLGCIAAVGCLPAF